MEEILRLEALQARTMLAFADDGLTEANSRNKYLGPTLLPAQPVDSLDFMYMRGAGNVPITAGIVEFNSPSPIGERRAQMDIVMGELVTIKHKLRIDAKSLLRVQTALNSNAPAELRAAVRAVFDDTEAVIGNVAARIESMIWEALSTGHLVYSGRDVQFSVNFGRPVENVTHVTVPWSNITAATPFSDLAALCDAMEVRFGVRPARAVCRRATWSHLLRNQKEAQLYVHGHDLRARPLVPGELNGLLAELDLPAVAVYEVQVAERDVAGVITSRALVPDNMVILLPPTNISLGRTLFGPTPTEVMNAGGYRTAIREMTERPRLVARVYKEGEDPGVIYTAAEATAIPTLPGIQYTGVLHTVPSAP